MKHKEAIEKTSLAERKGGYHASASEEIHCPDPKSTYFLPGIDDYRIGKTQPEKMQKLRDLIGIM